VKKWTTELLLLSVVIIWGINYTANKYGVSQLSPTVFNAVRFTVTAPILLVLTWLVEHSVRIRKSDLWLLSLVSIVGIALYQTLFSASVEYTSATNASLLIAMSPIFSCIFSALAKQEKFLWKQQAGSLIAFLGAAIVLLSGHHTEDMYPHAMVGDIFGFLASVSWGWYPVLTTPLLRQYSSLRIIAWTSLMGAVFLLVLIWVTGQPITFQLPALTYVSLLYSILFVTMYGLVIWYQGVGKVGTTKAMLYMYLVPVVAAVFAASVNHEPIHFGQVLGGILIVLGITYVKGGHDAIMRGIRHRRRSSAIERDPRHEEM
jgi:drug/metabolite transporter (DMT)-like permease